jgi:hypothetical protein
MSRNDFVIKIKTGVFHLNVFVINRHKSAASPHPKNKCVERERVNNRAKVFSAIDKFLRNVSTNNSLL